MGRQSDSQLVCEGCQKTFASVSSRNRHLRTVHRVEPRYTCPRCNKKCWSKTAPTGGNTKRYSLRDHLCEKITVETLLHPGWAELRAKLLKCEGFVEVKQ
jgi:hypothetical protein